MIKSTTIDLNEAMKTLTEHGSSDDPVVVRGVEMTAHEAIREAMLNGDTGAMRLTYWGEGPKGIRQIRGTLSGMVRDRAQMPRNSGGGKFVVEHVTGDKEEAEKRLRAARKCGLGAHLFERTITVSKIKVAVYIVLRTP